MAISLLLGLPVDEDEFLRRGQESETSRRSDYLAKWDDPGASAADRLDHLRGWWRRRYQADVAEPLRRLADAARAFGCRVVREAALGDVEAAAGVSKVIVVIGHWKGPELENDDFLGPGETIAARLDGIDHPLARWIVDSLAPKRGLGRLFSRALTPRDALRASLDAEIDGETPSGVDQFVELPQTRRSRRRDRLDSWLAGTLAPGNRLELWDGLHTKEAVAEALGAFEGIVDLTACTTTYLGAYIFLHSGGRCRTVQFLTVQEPVDFAARLAATLELAAQGYDYLTAREAVGRELIAIAENRSEKGPCSD